jgi:hypothetical protein
MDVKLGEAANGVDKKQISEDQQKKFNVAMQAIRKYWTEGCFENMGAFLCAIGITLEGSTPDRPSCTPNVVISPSFMAMTNPITHAFVFAACEELFNQLKNDAIEKATANIDVVVTDGKLASAESPSKAVN